MPAPKSPGPNLSRTFLVLSAFFADEENRVVFFFPPALLAAPSFDVPLFPFTLDARPPRWRGPEGDFWSG